MNSSVVDGNYNNKGMIDDAEEETLQTDSSKKELYVNKQSIYLKKYRNMD